MSFISTQMFPILARIARIILCNPTASADVGRLLPRVASADVGRLQLETGARRLKSKLMSWSLFIIGYANLKRGLTTHNSEDNFPTVSCVGDNGVLTAICNT